MGAVGHPLGAAVEGLSEARHQARLQAAAAIAALLRSRKGTRHALSTQKSVSFWNGWHVDDSRNF